MQLPRHSFDDPYEAIAKSLCSAGCAVIEGGTRAPQLGDMPRQIAEQLEPTPCGTGVFVGRQTKRLGAIIRRFETSHTLALDPAVLHCMDEVLLPNCTRYQLHITQAIQVHPGETAQVIHRDNAMYPHVAIQGELMVNAMWAISEFSEENGATRVVPGSHQWDQERQASPEETVSAEMAPGSALLYLGSTLHGAGANQAHTPRTGLVMGYCLGWLRQYENQYLAVPPASAKALPAELAALIGYAAHRPNLGLYECRDPMDFYGSDLPASAAAHDVLDPETQKALDGLVAAD